MEYNSVCPACGRTFYCGAKEGDKTCWCFDKEPIKRDPNAKDCLCEYCLGNTNKYRGIKFISIWIMILLGCIMVWSWVIAHLIRYIK